MADDKKNFAQDRKLVAETEPYEVEYFARKHGLTAGEAREVLAQTSGNSSRELADELAAAYKRKEGR
ncbi:MAG: hypothetical protein JWR75_1448 [Devosia sp.]|nr:hypothetical protein [Devosia sp.]